MNRSDWCWTLERVGTGGKGRWALRMGLCMVQEIGLETGTVIAAARETGPFADLPDFCTRTRLSQEVVRNLIRAGACGGWGERRTLLWQLDDLDLRPGGLPLTQPRAADAASPLPELPPPEQTAWEYELMGASPAGQVMRHHRRALRSQGVLTCAQVKRARAPGAPSAPGALSSSASALGPPKASCSCRWRRNGAAGCGGQAASV